MSSWTGSIEVPGGASFELSRSRGIEDLPEETVLIRAGGVEVTLDEDSATLETLGLFRDAVGITDDEIVRSDQLENGFVMAWKSGNDGEINVSAVFGVIICGGSSKRAADVDTVYRICSSYRRPHGDTMSAGAAAATQPADLPAIDLSPISRSRIDESRGLNRSGLKHQRSGALQEAIGFYEKAIHRDPGNIVARYNLATAYARLERVEGALSILQQFAQQPDCPVCRGRLVRARQDSDFDTVRDNETFRSLTAAVDVDQTTAKQAAQSISEALESNELAPIRRYIHPRTPIRWSLANDRCDIDCGGQEPVIGVTAFETLVGESGPFAIAQVRKCAKDCCELDVEPDDAGDALVELTRLCFDVDSGGVRTLRSVDTYEGM